MNETLQIACPHCHSLNRVPADRLADQPNCGRCQGPLFDAKPVDLDAASFARHVERSDLPVLVDFWAPWCGPCKMMAPQFEQAARMLEPRVRLAKLNTEAEQGLAARYGIRSIPTMILFYGGREVARQSGAMGAQDIVRWAAAQLPR
ncbi:thioredoxin TrxC [Rehaibacterium terrae]|uniref:Thioredoxin n=1 Tax=Rehaibacterium terrae TaxID=1341696 RepID=A0A7W7Y1X4_9GAMM|nr:thioredoxin TrxC [Rehaibacterium terrae]MBB5016602.1 thioredoxin 2 [Rehaibacterium terrae]MDX5299692.1 thioredoxin TrxC [Gammaproteobacteria bacterium]